MFKKDDFVYLTKSLDTLKAPELDPLIAIYDKIYEKEEEKCSCEVVPNFINSYNRGNLFTKAIYILKIKKDQSNEVCLKFLLLHHDFSFKNIGLNAASQFYFHKKIEELNEKEKITLIVMFKNSALYNPIRNNDRLERKVLLYQNIIHKTNFK